MLVPAEVDAETGYRASLRRIGVPLARIRDVLALDPATAAEEISAYWARPRPSMPRSERTRRY